MIEVSQEKTILTCPSAQPAFATLVLAHGAGSPMDHPWMESMTEALIEQGIKIARFEFPYMHQRRTTGVKRPPPRIQDVTRYYNSWLHAMHSELKDKPLFIGGKSMGARAATLLGSKDYTSNNQDMLDGNSVFDDYIGTVCFGYPFHPARKPEKLRIDPLFHHSKPLFIAQGTRDAFGNKQEVKSYGLPFATMIAMHWVESGDHDLKPLKRSGQQFSDAIECTAIAVAAFMRKQIRAGEFPNSSTSGPLAD